jgi:Kef-type K+ transport system membrane component KefB
MLDVAATHLMIGLLLSAGLLLGLIATRLGIPRVTAYVFAGVIFSPRLLGGPLGFEAGSATEVLTSTALGVIAYLIGGSVTTGQLRRTGRVILLALVGETLGAGVAVWLAVRAVVPEEINGVSPDSLALILGAAAATTAPAATLAVLHQYRARGPLSETLLGVVALDDATGIMLFALAVVVTTGSTILTGLAQAGFEIVGSIGLGIGAGYLLSRLSRHLHDRSLWLPAVMAALLVTIGLAGFSGLSPLLAAIALGFSARFILAGAGDRLLVPVEQLEEFVFLTFFTVAGAHFDFELLSQNVALVGAYRPSAPSSSTSFWEPRCSTSWLVPSRYTSRWAGPESSARNAREREHEGERVDRRESRSRTDGGSGRQPCGHHRGATEAAWGSRRLRGLRGGPGARSPLPQAAHPVRARRAPPLAH